LGLEGTLLFFFAVVLPIWNFHRFLDPCMYVYYHGFAGLSTLCASSVSGSTFSTIFWRRFFCRILVIKF